MLEEKFVSFSDNASGGLAIHDAVIIKDKDDPIGVDIAARSLVKDLKDITGSETALVEVTTLAGTDTLLGGKSVQHAIILATTDSGLAKLLESTDKIDLTEIRGKWETFITAIVQRPLPNVEAALVIIGSDKRGTIFGIHTLAEQCGQSPLWWWNDVPATQHKELYALPKITIHGEPSVKYRGLFINDEAPALMTWWNKTKGTVNTPLNTEFYVHVYDLMLRLKANYLWPAMWASWAPQSGRTFFLDDPQNHQLAHDYGIVIGTSHHEPMQRLTNEWALAKAGPWDWEKNKENITEFMDEGIKRSVGKESIYTLGIRGEYDGPMDAKDPSAILRDVFEVQNSIIKKHVGEGEGVVKMWAAYKEVLTYYENGLVPDDDTIIMLTDDNWGNVVRLPTDEECKRKSGWGLYHHLAYVGRPKSYKWQNTNNLPKHLKELKQAFDRGVDKIWIMNVGDIKPVEMPLTFTMALAWDINSINFETIPSFLQDYATRDYGAELADEIASLLFAHSHLLGLRKYEMIQPDTYSIKNFQEAERVLERWRVIADQAIDLRDRIADTHKAAFHHVAYYPIVAGYNYHRIALGQATNKQYAFERRNATNTIAQEVLQAFERDQDLVEEYDTIANGKWAGMTCTPKFDMDIATWVPPASDVVSSLSYVQQRQDSDPTIGNLGIFVENSDTAQWQGRVCGSTHTAMPSMGMFSPVMPQFSPYGPESRVVELFHRGDHRKPIEWSIKVPHDWVKVSQSSGVLDKEGQQQRLHVSIDWSAVPQDFDETVQLHVKWNPDPYFDLIHLPIFNKLVPANFQGFPEIASYISIEAPHFQTSSQETICFRHIPYLGSRSESGSLALRPYVSARSAREAAKQAFAEYNIFIFSESQDPWTATLYINGSLDTDPTLPMEVSLSIDDVQPEFSRVLGEATAQEGNYPPGWRAKVADHVWKKDIDLGVLNKGKHVLRWRDSSPEVYLEKIVVHRGVVESYLGPPETRLVGTGR